MSRPATFEAAPRLFNGIIDRAQTEMPEWYLRSAQEVLIAAPDILSTSGQGTFYAAAWSRGASGFKKASRDGKSVLWVQPCDKFWIIERSIRLDAIYMRDEALISAFGARPIWTRTRQAAMQLAEHCDPMPRDPVAGYWADVGMFEFYQRNYPTGQRGKTGDTKKAHSSPHERGHALCATRASSSDSGKPPDSFCHLGH